MRDARLDVALPEGFKAELGVERSHVLLSVQQHRLVAVPIHHTAQDQLREAFAATIRPHDHPSETELGVEMRGCAVDQYAQVGDSACGIGYPEVLGGGFLVTVVELFFVDSLLDEEDIGAQLDEGVELLQCELAP